MKTVCNIGGREVIDEVLRMVDKLSIRIKEEEEEKKRVNKNVRNGKNKEKKEAEKYSDEMADLVDCRLENKLFFDSLEWLTTAEAAIFLRKFCPAGRPSVNAVHKLVSQGKVRRRKFAGRLYFKKKELNYLIESSVA